jgi:hypothetical protein
MILLLNETAFKLAINLLQNAHRDRMQYKHTFIRNVPCRLCKASRRSVAEIEALKKKKLFGTTEILLANGLWDAIKTGVAKYCVRAGGCQIKTWKDLILRYFWGD